MLDSKSFTNKKFVKELTYEILFILVPITVIIAIVYAQDFKPLDRINHISIFSKLILFILLSITIAIYIWQKFFYNKKVNSNYLFAFVYGNLMGVIFAAYLLALRGSNLSFGPTGSDIWNLQIMAQSFIDDGKVVCCYPPGYPTILGLFSLFLDTTPEYAMKITNYSFAFIIILFAWISLRVVFKPYIVIFLATIINLVNSLGHDKPYYLLSVFLYYPSMILFTRMSLEKNNRIEVTKSIYIGITIGLSAYFYSAWLYWSILGNICLIIFLLKYCKNRIALIWNSIIVVFFFLVSSNTYSISIITSKIEQHSSKILNGTKPIQDAYQLNQSLAYYGENFLNLEFLSWTFVGDLFFLAIFAVSLFALFINYEMNKEMVVIIFSALSSWVFGLYLSARMYDLQAINLWPRSESALIISLMFLLPYALRFVQQYLYKSRIIQSRNNYETGIVTLYITFLIFLLYSPVVNTAIKLMPSPGNVSYEAQVESGAKENTIISGRDPFSRFLILFHVIK